ncbi:MAG: hypothetical protein HS111_11655 [Kofleriaceae bacterium]|nr:hypothetical protein [Kofleriaceae bacterium]MCL4228214.1 hypothetical protein [Myxococcales bacterium]
MPARPRASHARAATAVAVLALAPACGIGFADDTSGGHDDLPTSGAGPFGRLPVDETTPADEPWLATDRTLDFTEPALVARAGGGFVHFVTRESPDLPVGDSEIWRGAIRDPRQLPDEPLAPAVIADQAWEEGHVAAPAVVDDGARLVMFYEGGLTTVSVGRAVSSDGGRTWQKDPAPVLVGARAPGVAFDGALWLAAFTRPGEVGIWLARSGDGVAWVVDAAPTLVPTGVEDSFERVAVGSPWLAWVVESTGRGHWAMWYAGLEKFPLEGDLPRPAIGYVASFDGMAWGRSGAPRPVLAAPAGAPAVLVSGPRATLLFDGPAGRRLAVGVATHP